MSISLIGKDGTNIASSSNPNPVQVYGSGATSSGLPLYVQPSDYGFAKDAFERQRTSEIRIAFEQNFAVPLDTLQWESTAVASGTYTTNVNNANSVLATNGTTSGSGYWIQSYSHTHYAPGISHLIRVTFNFVAQIANLIMRVGAFTDQSATPITAPSGDGVFVESNGTTINIVLRSFIGGTTQETRVAQSSWNLDKLNGTGTSAVTLDWTKANHLVIEYPWLGVGPVTVGFETNQGVVWAHQFAVIGSITNPYSRTGTLPIRAECYANGTLAQTGQLQLFNCVVQQEGDVLLNNRPWRHRTAQSGATARTGGTAVANYPLIGWRMATTANSPVLRGFALPISANIMVGTAATTSTVAKVALVIPTTAVTGATFAVTAGNIQVDIAATAATAVTGTEIASWILPVTAGLYTIDFTPFHDTMMKIGQNAQGSLTATINSMFLTYGPYDAAAGAGAAVRASVNLKERA